MKDTDRNYLIYLNDIHTAILRIVEYVGTKNSAEFKQSFMVVDAVVRNFEIIGEASKNLPDVIKDKYPNLPWRKMYGLRNLVSHEYFGIDYDMIWDISTINIPENIIQIKKIIEAENDTFL
ncbi:MAG: DUF86 domain-containing protein [Bacteroidales bacterium]|nr:DUF86 domain-containing protein [Bacteroidales bacterium]MCF8455301.1 DUF86 domain-containing protein [Bacteroidales bacterium]